LLCEKSLKWWAHAIVVILFTVSPTSQVLFVARWCCIVFAMDSTTRPRIKKGKILMRRIYEPIMHNLFFCNGKNQPNF
jgi:hypothetical protein